MNGLFTARAPDLAINFLNAGGFFSCVFYLHISPVNSMHSNCMQSRQKSKAAKAFRAPSFNPFLLKLLTK